MGYPPDKAIVYRYSRIAPIHHLTLEIQSLPMDTYEQPPALMVVEPVAKGEPEENGERHGREMRDLIRTLGRDCALVVTARKPERPGPFFFGSGRLEELKLTALDEDCGLIIIDDDLTPLQQRNLEEFFGCEVMDREAVILEIFAARARTKEASLQVDLARLRYRLPRVSRISAGGERQRGGVKGTKGSGETRQETDKRIIRKRITGLEEEITAIRQSRNRQRSGRIKGGLPLIALAGYTNAGKSTLLNALSGSALLAEDALFATLDPSTRRIRLPGLGPALLTDTVGFIRKLPHHLVDSFRATLEEITLADLIIHVVDASSHEKNVHMATTTEVLQDLSALQIPRLVVFNKTDRADPEEISFLQTLHPEARFVSAVTGKGLPELLTDVAARLRTVRVETDLLVPPDRGDILSYIMRHYALEEIPTDESGYHIRISLTPEDASRLAPFRSVPYNG